MTMIRQRLVWSFLCVVLLFPAGAWAQAKAAPAKALSSDELAAKQFLDLLVLDHDAMRRTNLFRRWQLVHVSKLYQSKKYLDAVKAFERYFFYKLRDPQQFGLALSMANPYSRGIAGGVPGMSFVWPPAVLKPQSPKKVLKRVSKFLDGTVKMGKPADVNWYAPYTRETINQLAGKVPNPSLTNGMAFKSLAQAYMYTGNADYLKCWSAYMDAWARNADYVERIDPMFVSDSGNGGTDTVIYFIKLLGGLAHQIAPNQAPQLIPPATFARVMGKYVTRFPPLTIMYLRSNTHNWTPNEHTMALALWLDEYKFAQLYFREARRRHIEDVAVTQNLPDGTSTELDPWYNENYLQTAGALTLLNRRSSIDSWKDLPWVNALRGDLQWRIELQHHINSRVNYLIRMRTPQNEWPVGLNGGDKRTAAGLSFVGIAQSVYAKPQNRKLITAVHGSNAHPDYTSEWFPYAGYNLARDGWDRNSGYGFLFCTPHPAAYGAYRGRSNNNFFGVNGYGQDLLVDKTTGHYMYPSSPIIVDGKRQFFNAGIYKVHGPAAHKVYEIAAWSEPAPWRWYASDRFNVMEGIYSGPWGNGNDGPVARHGYGPEQSKSDTLSRKDARHGTTHQRLVLYVRDAHLWIVTDRMLAEGEHTYTQKWHIPILPSPTAAFDPKDIHVNSRDRSVITDEETYAASGQNPPKNYRRGPKANLAMYQFSTDKLAYTQKNTRRKSRYKGRVLMYSWQDIGVKWAGRGDQQLVTAIHIRKPGDKGADKLRSIHRITGGARAVGFTAVLPDGKTVRYLASPQRDDTLTLGNVAIHGQALLLAGDHGIALNVKHMSIAGKPVKVEHTDFVFTIDGSTLGKVSPIYRPIQRVMISPARDVFVGEQEITLTCPTAGVEIRYTLDGSDPTPRSTLYTKPFTITRDVVIRARAYRPGVEHNPVQMSGTEATVPWLAAYNRKGLEPVTRAYHLKPGLAVRYYQDSWQDMFLKIDELRPQARGTSKSVFDLSLIPASNPRVTPDAAAPRKKAFGLVYSGYLDVPADGVYTLHAPYEYVWPDVAAGYELRIYLGDHRVGRDTMPTEWYPATRRHGFGTWSIALEKGTHPFKVVYIDYRMNAAEKLNRPNVNDYIWSGITPKLTITGPGIDKPEAIPDSWLKH